LLFFWCCWVGWCVVCGCCVDFYDVGCGDGYLLCVVVMVLLVVLFRLVVVVLVLFIVSVFEGCECNCVFGLFIVVLIGGVVIGLVVGGMFVEWVLWCWVMYVNVLIGIGVFVVVVFVLFEMLWYCGWVDVEGVIILMLGMILFVYGFVSVVDCGWSSVVMFGLFVVVVVLLVVFVVVECCVFVLIMLFGLFCDVICLVVFVGWIVFVVGMMGMFFFMI